MNAVKEWMSSANKTEQEQLAALAKTSRAHLRHLSMGRRVASADLAQQLEAASTQLSLASRGRLKVLRREDMSPACGRCDYAKQCAAAKAMADALMPGLTHKTFDPVKAAPELFRKPRATRS